LKIPGFYSATTTRPVTETPAYQVSLPVFEGPLDLLLHLIERQELDITQVSLARVTNQYLDYLARISERDPDNLADFLVVAAKLLLIKSRVLLPRPPALPASEEEDVGEDLVRQLIEYKRFKEAAQWLQEVEAQGLRSYVRLAAAPHLEPVIDLGDVSLDDLLTAVREVLAIKPPAPSVDNAVAPITITIADQIQLIERRTAGGQRVSFRRLLRRARSRIEVIVTLLALLEMVKQLRVRMQQDQLFGDILIVAREGPGKPV
jgi:segregation and condensation protein A